MMIRSVISLIFSLGLSAGGITTATLDRLHIAHDPAQFDGDYMTTLVDCELRAGPGNQFAILATIPAGTRLPLIYWYESDNDDVFVRTVYNGKRGWVNDQLFKTESLVKYNRNSTPFTRASLQERCIVTLRPLPLYQYAMEGHDVLASIPSNTLLINRSQSIQFSSDGPTFLRAEYQGMDGWIVMENCNSPLQIVSEHWSDEFVSTLVRLNLREKPSITSNKLDTIPAGVSLPLTMWDDKGGEGCWMMTTYNGKTGWLCGEKYYDWAIKTDDGRLLTDRKEKALRHSDRWAYPATKMTGSEANSAWRSGPGMSFPPLAGKDGYSGDGYIIFTDDDWALVQTFILMGWVPIDVDGKPNMIIYSALSPMYDSPPQAHPAETIDGNWDYVGFTLLRDGYPTSNKLYIELAIYFHFKGDIDSMAIKPVSIYQPPEATEPLYKGKAHITHTSGVYETGHFYYAMEMPESFKFNEPFRLDATIKCKGVKELEITYPPPPEE